jgi:formamidase
MPSGYLDQVAQTIPGPLTDQICALARETGKWIVPGSIVERDGESLHNTALAISPDGEVVARYRKLFPWMPHETSVPGDQYVTFDIPGVGRFGLAICYDGWVPEIIRSLAWMGAEVILQPTYTRTSDRAQELILAQANAIANQVYVVNPNIGQIFGTGRSVVVDPEGRVLAEGGNGEEFLTLFLDLDLVATIREYGTAGLNALWKQLRESAPPFPPAIHGYAQGEVMRDLGPFPGLRCTPQSRTSPTGARAAIG